MQSFHTYLTMEGLQLRPQQEKKEIFHACQTLVLIGDASFCISRR